MRAFLSMLEAGDLLPLTVHLEARIAADVLAALRRHGIFRPASPATTLPCDDPKRTPRCHRRVTRAPRGSGAPLVGVCRIAPQPGGCPDIDVLPEDVAREELSIPDLWRAMRVLYDADGRGRPVAATLQGELLSIGFQGSGEGQPDERELFLVVGPKKLRVLLSMMNYGKRALVLVPTADALTAPMRDKHAPGSPAPVWFESLEESLGIRHGKLVRLAVRGLRAPDAPELPDPPRDEGARPAAPANAGCKIPGAKTWNDALLTPVDPTTVRVRVGRRSYLRTGVDLGIPERQFQLLVAFCKEGGCFKSWRFGTAAATKQLVWRLGLRLRVVFGLEDSPFDEYRADIGWRARFRTRAHDD
jgi:hypothetical protein